MASESRLSNHEKVLHYLRDHNVMTLATAGPEGLWAAALFFANNEFDFYFLSSPTSRHCLNLHASSAISATIQDDYRDWPQIKGVQLEGKAWKITGPEQVKAIDLYGARYPFIGHGERLSLEVGRAMRRIEWYKLVPSRLYFIDNSLGLGHRDEIALPGASREKGKV